MPQQELEVQVKSPPRIIWYWVLKQNIDRLQDALRAERADRRLEYMFGFGGFALGTARDAFLTVSAVIDGRIPSLVDFFLTVTFIVAAILLMYFWSSTRNKEIEADSILSEILEKEYQTDVVRPSVPTGIGHADAATGDVREGTGGVS